ncbi:HAMP domain-containing sensor histidine kinase [Microbulbifer sp. SAOS-129_SWC]|uniref:sensor histidine kinase n=1 Tax=Microbulbifer sp. SAOS-129_SWC TaxID=3145235 RepID=UPI003217AF06
MRLQLLRLLGSMALALVIVFTAISALREIYADSPEDYVISATQLAKALERGDTPLAQSYPINAIHFPHELNHRLAAGDVVGLETGDGQILFYRLTDKGFLQMGPFAYQPAESVMHWRLLLVGTVMIALLLLIWPMFRDLNRLQNLAIRFSKKPFKMPAQIKRRSTIYPLAETFRRMANIVMGYCQMNQDLARTIAHEIRMPLARIKFQMALEKSSNDGARVIEQATRDIEQMVDKYLSFARVEINEEFIVRSEQSLEDFFADLGSTLETQCPEMQIGFYFPDGAAWFEPDSLTIAIQNLVVNASKYARDRVDLYFEYSETGCTLSIEDNGPGLGGDALELTDAFSRAATDDQGYGLGLYIVKKVMMWHDGDLHMDRSPKLGGTRATLRWPNCA